MELLWNGLTGALQLLLERDPLVLHAAWRSLWISGLAVALAACAGIPLGFLLGWLLLSLAASGHPVPALILPMYFLADATITLVRRAARGEKIWEAHREHFYQVAVKSGLRHDQVNGIIMVANIFLIALALVAMRGLPWPAVSGAVAAVVLLLFLLAKGGPTE